jgi:hypothetical protein
MDIKHHQEGEVLSDGEDLSQVKEIKSLRINFCVVMVMFKMRAPKRVLYVCLTATKIGVRRWSHGFCHTGSLTLLSSFWAIFVFICAPFRPLNGASWADNPLKLN